MSVTAGYFVLSYFLFFRNELTGLHVHVRRRGTAAGGSYRGTGVLRLGVTKMIRLVVLCFLLLKCLHPARRIILVAALNFRACG